MAAQPTYFETPTPYGATQPPTDPQYGALTPSQEALVATLALWLGMSVGFPFPPLPHDLRHRLAEMDLHAKAIQAAIRMALSVPIIGRGKARTPVGRTMSAGVRVAAGEPRMRALYLLRSAQRMSRSLTNGVDSVTAIRAERPNLDRSTEAARRRDRAAVAVDAAAEISPWIEWVSIMDGNTTPDCRAMNGKIFTLDEPPAIGFPGAVHPACRCEPRPFGESLINIGALPLITTSGVI
jgi:SPP1 gp7 family putative phage head morphogenesis protein